MVDINKKGKIKKRKIKDLTQKGVEKRALIITIIVNFLMAVAGLVVYFITNLQSIFLDGFFTLISCCSTVLAIFFAKISKKKNVSYPTGMFFLEPFYGVIKSILIFVLLTVATVVSSNSAYEYFKYGSGQAMNISLVLPYTIIILGICFGLYMFNKKQNQKINNTSTILTAEAKSNLVDTMISCGILTLLIVLLFVDKDGKFGFMHYTGDFFITIALVLISIKEPIALLALSIREISGATVKDKEIKSKIRKIVAKEIKEEDLDNKFEVYKIGMHIRVVILLNENIEIELLKRLKTETIKEIKENFDSVSVEFVIRK